MGAIDSKKLNAALSRAKNIGLVEEPFTVVGCDLVLRSLRSEDYTAVMQECDGLPEEEYIHRYQKGHIARSIVEINGVDLRDSKFVTVDETDASGAVRPVKLELPQYLTKHMLDTWGKEAVDVTFRKLSDVLERAERQAKEGITFIVPDETPEEKFRRLLLETRAAEKDVPGTLLDKILEEQGLVRKEAAEEVRRALERADKLAQEQEAKVAEQPAEPPQSAPEPVPLPVVPVSGPPPARPAPVDPHATLQQAIASRGTPIVQSEQTDVRPNTRRAQIAALEGTMPDVEEPDLGSAISLQAGDPAEVVEIRRDPIDVQAASTIVDNPPIAGINPRFRPPQRA